MVPGARTIISIVLIYFLMVRRKSACGLCKPHKKWKQTDTKAKQKLRREIEFEILTSILKSRDIIALS